MDNFLDFLSEYNAKAAAAISIAVAESNNGKANMMSSLKTTANDNSLSQEVRLNALTALINLGNLLDIPLPPYFPSVTTYANTQTFVGVHDNLDGIQGGAPGEYYHLTNAERTSILNKASIGDITWANLGGVYSQNVSFAPVFDAKQNALSAPASGTYFVKVTGNTVSYDNNTYITTINGISAGGELEGTYPNPTLSNAAVIGKVLTGFDPFASTGSITDSDTILSALEKLNANIDNVISNPSGVASVAFTNNAASVFTTTASPSTGAASLSLSLNSQTGNLVLASPNATTGQPSFRSLVAADFPNSGVTAGTYGSTTVIPQIQVDAKGRITSVTSVTAASGGQVNTITLAVPSFLSPSNVNNTLPANPQIVIQLDTQAANTVFAGPITGAAVVPTFRSLVSADIPNIAISQVTGLSSTLSGFLTNNLSDGSIWIGNTSNAAVQRVLSGDVSVSNEGVTAIGLAKVQYNMIQDVTTQTLLGRYSAIDGEVEQVTLSGDFLLNSSTGVLSLSSPVSPVVSVKGDLLGHDLTNQQRVPSSNVDGDILLVNNSATGAYTDLGLNWVTMSGDATINAAGAITIAAGAVTLAKMANLAANSFIGNNTGSAATPIALTVAQATAMLNQFTTSAKGLAPGVTGPAVGDATYFLNATGAWSQPAGGGGTTTFPLTMDNSGSGATSGTTFDGSVARTISYNTIGAPKVDGTGASGTWSISVSGNAGTVTNGLYSTGSYSNPTWLTSISGGIVSGNISGNAANVTGIVALANGGTNANNAAINGGVAYSTASAINITAAGTSGQILKSNGAAAPTWTTATYPSTTTKDKILVSTANDVVGQIDAPTSNNTFLKWNAGVFSWDTAGSGSGTVTSGNQYQLAYYAANGTTVSGLTLITPSRALVSDANGLPVASSVSTTQLQYLSSATGTTGTTNTNLVFSTSPTLVTPVLGVASATSINKVAITAPATSATLTIADGKTATISNTLTFTGTDGSSVAFGAGGTVAYVGLANSWTSGIKQTFAPSATNAGINVGALAGQPSSPVNGDLVYNSSATALQAYINGAWVSLGSGGGGSGTVNSGTQYQLAYYATTGTAVSGLTTGTNGQVLVLNAGLVPTWTTLSTSTTLTNIGAATASATLSNAAASVITWNWNSNTTTNSFVLGSTGLTSGSLFTLTHTTSALTGNLASFTSTGVTSGNLLALGISGTSATSADNLSITNTATTNTSGRGIDIAISGATNSGITYGAYISNTKTGTSSTNTALYLTASGGTTNYALDVAAGSSRFAAGTASVPQIILTPSTAAGGTTFTGIVNGSLWYDTNSTTTNSSLTLYKDSANTKILTRDRNSDFVTSAQGVLVADATGTLTKSADLTALGILATYSTYTTTTTPTNIFSTVSFVGSTGLPANFFAAGKTILVVLNGQYTSTAGSPTVVLTLAFGTYSQTFTVNLHAAVTTASLWRAEFIITCSASGASGSLRTMAQAIAIDDLVGGTPKFTKLLLQTASSFNTTSASTISLNASYGTPATSAPIDMCQITYLN